MIFTFRANKKAVEDAATKNREEGREEGREEMRQEWQDWLDQIKDKSREDWPPPPTTESKPANGQKNE